MGWMYDLLNRDEQRLRDERDRYWGALHMIQRTVLAAEGGDARSAVAALNNVFKITRTVLDETSK